MKRLLISSLLVAAVVLSGAVDFDAVDDVFDCGTASDVASLSPITVSAWVYATGGGEGGDATLIGKPDHSDWHYRWFIRTENDGGSSGTLAWRFNINNLIGTNQWISDDNALRLNQWDHWLFSWDGTTFNGNCTTVIQAYRNGVNMNGTSGICDGGGATPDAAETLRVGNDSDTDHTFDGQIACLALWEAAPTANDIQLLVTGPCRNVYKTSMGQPRRFWPMDYGYDGETGSGTGWLRDLSGNAGHCTPSNSPIFRAAPIPY